MIPSPYGQKMSATEDMNKIKDFIEELGYKDYVVSISSESDTISDIVSVETVIKCSLQTVVSLISVLYKNFDDIL